MLELKEKLVDYLTQLFCSIIPIAECSPLGMPWLLPSAAVSICDCPQESLHKNEAINFPSWSRERDQEVSPFPKDSWAVNDRC